MKISRQIWPAPSCPELDALPDNFYANARRNKLAISQIRKKTQATVQSPAMPSTATGQLPTALAMTAVRPWYLAAVGVSISPMWRLAGMR